MKNILQDFLTVSHYPGIFELLYHSELAKDTLIVPFFGFYRTVGSLLDFGKAYQCNKMLNLSIVTHIHAATFRLLLFTIWWWIDFRCGFFPSYFKYSMYYNIKITKFTSKPQNSSGTTWFLCLENYVYIPRQ